MHLYQAFQLALHSMRVARLRTALTTLGIAVGVAAVILLAGLGTGVRQEATGSLSAFSNTITVTQLFSTEIPGGATRPLRDRDAEALASSPDALDIAEVTPMISGTALANDRGADFRSVVIGSTPGYFRLFDYRISAGRIFSPAEVVSGERVAVVGPGLVRTLYRDDPALALGSGLKLGRLTYTVVGVMGGGNASGGAPDDLVVVPLEAGRALFGRNDRLGQIGVVAADTGRVTAAMAQINTVMDRQHGIREPGYRDYSLAATLPQLRRTNAFLSALAVITLGVAAIALFVGGLGIANIMLVTVTERTREIGVHRAVGARRAAILAQFLIEGMVLAGAGGALGVLAGVLAVAVAARVLPRLGLDYGVPTVSVPVVLAAFAVSLLIGLGGAGYPALRAARLKPIDALRH